MAPLRRSTCRLCPAAMAGAAALMAAGSVAAAPSSCGCGPTTPAPPTTPSPPTSGSGSGSGSGAGRSYTYGAASSTSTSAASITTTLRGTGVGGAQALANTVGGGYGAFSESGGVTTTLDSVQVESPVQTSRVCAAFRAAARMMTLRASCLDDKDVPHPASQVSPERRVADVYEGEIYRCIAGTRLQYTLLQSETAMDGRSVSCRKGDALFRQRDGRLECRVQKPARDCNERSLLRRYGAGMKLVAVFEQQECVSWRQAGDGPSAPQSSGPSELHVSEP